MPALQITILCFSNTYKMSSRPALVAFGCGDGGAAFGTWRPLIESMG